MKKLFFILTLLSMSAHAGVNEKTVECLSTQNYSRENFNGFNFEKAAKCQNNYVYSVIQKEEREIHSFLQENPHYRGDGSGWYKSVEIYGTR